jgi:hypothetical protein
MRKFRKSAVSMLEKARRMVRLGRSLATRDLPAAAATRAPINKLDEANSFLTVDITSSYSPEPGDPEREYEIFRRLLSLSESDVPLGDDVFALNDIQVTPWAAARMGAHLEYVKNTTARRAFRAATVAMRASRETGPPQLVIGNLLSAGNLFLRFGNHKAAAASFEGILATPFARGSSERVAAHLGMANIHFLAEKYHDAAWHYDKCLPYLRLIMQQQGRRGVLETAYTSYRKCNEFGGILYCLREMKPEHARKFEKRLGEFRPSLDIALLTVARLNLLGDFSAAGRLSSAWGLT